MAFHKRKRQISLYEYPGGFQGASLDPNNRWILLSKEIPWDLVEELYAKNFKTKEGNLALSSRIAFGALFLKGALNVSDAALVEHIRENPYLQFFLGFEEFSSEPPFDLSMMSYFRKRFSEEDIARINEEI